MDEIVFKNDLLYAAVGQYYELEKDMKTKVVSKSILVTTVFILFQVLGILPLQAQSEFGAYYTHLNSGEPFEDASQTFEYADLVVRLNDTTKFIFWRASSYRPHLDVSGTKYYVDELVATNGDGPGMRFDRVNAYSWVKLVSSTDTNAVVEWRYRPDFSNIADDSGIVYETYTINSNGNVTREVKHGGAKLKDWLDPNNMTTQTFTLTPGGIGSVNTVKGQRINGPGSAISGSDVKTNYVAAPVKHFRFDEGLSANYDTTYEAIDGTHCDVNGRIALWKYSDISGTCLQFDSYTSDVSLPAADAPSFNGMFSIEAWIAIGAYPLKYGPIAQQSRWKDEKLAAGYYFGVDHLGYLVLMAYVDGGPQRVVSGTTILVNKWTHVMATYDKTTSQMSVFINGNKAGETSIGNSNLIMAPVSDLTIGLNNSILTPSNAVRDWATFPSLFGFDGLIDEVRIYDMSLSPEQVYASYNNLKPTDTEPDMEARNFPADPKGKAADEFKIEYTNLDYHDAWDNLWCKTDNDDVVVTFDEVPIMYASWKGTRFAPVMVTENRKIIGDQSDEIYIDNPPSPPTGCLEHMSDTKTKYAHVRIVEKSPARAVLSYRYALVDVQYNIGNYNPDTGWGTWAEEYWVFFPDGVASRYMRQWNEWFAEPMMFNEPGTRPDDNINIQAVTLVDNKNQTTILDWTNESPDLVVKEQSVIWYNMKSTFKPAIILPKGTGIEVYPEEEVGGPPNTNFWGWNHYPVSQMISDGRVAQSWDRMTHTSMVLPVLPENANNDGYLYSVTNGGATSQTMLQRSWNYAPEIVKMQGGTSSGYQYYWRTYEFHRTDNTMTFNIKASNKQPINNLCFKIYNWGSKAPADLKINGVSQSPGHNFRQGVVIDTSGNYAMVIWVGLTATSNQSFEITVSDAN